MNRVLTCIYDMMVNPCSYDFFTFLISAEICRIRRNLSEIKLIFVQGPNNKFRDDKLRSAEQNKVFFDTRLTKYFKEDCGLNSDQVDYVRKICVEISTE